MTAHNEIAKRVAAALEVEHQVNLHRYPVDIQVEGGVVTLSGTVEHIAAKRRAVIVAAAIDGVREVVDRLRVEAAEAMGQDQILQHVRDALYEEPALCEIRLVTVNKKDEKETARDPDGARGEIIVMVDADGRVVLGGQVPGLSQRRLAELLAWWVPGSTDVVNDLEVVPPEEDSDGEILDAVELALEKDHLVDAADITLSCRDAVVTLAGGIPSGRQSLLAECDAWYIHGVRDVQNHLVPIDPA